ncbi:MAG: amino acid permease [Bacteroidia bacterium]|nr:amino acid permease [Bacteroidia bacterium]
MAELKPKITGTGLTLIVIGSCIGSGIFITPSRIAGLLDSPSLILLLWIVGGLITISGALSYAELASRFPQAGGVYVYLREAFGSVWAFLFGWVVLTAVTSGALAALALAFTQFLGLVIPEIEPYRLPVAAGVLIITSVANVFGVQVGQFFSNLFTSLKVAGIVFIILCGLFVFNGESRAMYHTPEVNFATVQAFFLALTGVYWSYGGWQHATYISSEVINPGKNIAKAMIQGSCAVMLIYLLSNMAYMNVMDLDSVAASERVAADMMQEVLPGYGSRIMAIIVSISVFGTIAIYTMTAPRIYFAMASDGVFFSGLTRIHPKFHTPIPAILLQSGWAILLLFFWGTFSNLIEYVTFTEGVFLAMAALSVIVLRKKIQEPPGFRSPLYPLLPLFYFSVSVLFLGVGLYSHPVQALAALVIFSSGLIVYLFFRKRRKTLI